MIIKKLIMKNIRSFEELEVDFQKGSTLLSGEIGVGKTSILLGLQFALFGLQPGQKGASILRQGENASYVGLEIEVDGDKIFIERTIKASRSGGITQDSNFLTVNDSREELSTSEMKDRVITILNYPKEFVKKSNLLFKFTVFTPQEEMKAIIQERPEIRLDTLRHIFGIDRYKRIKENSSIFIQRIKDSIKIKEVLVGELNLLKEKYNLENEKKILFSRDVNNLALEYNGFLKEKEESDKKLESFRRVVEDGEKISSEISKIQIRLQGKKDLENRLKKEIMALNQQIKEDIDFSEERLRSVSGLYEKHKTILEGINSEFLKVSSEISGLNSKKEGPLLIREKVNSMKNCPTCFQEVGLDHKHKISKRTDFEIEDINRVLERKIVERESLVRDIEKEKELIGGYEEDKNNLERNKVRYEHRREIEIKIKSDSYTLDITNNEISTLEKELEELNEKLLDYKDSLGMVNAEEEKNKNVSSKVREAEISLATKNKELEMLKNRLEELGDEVSSKEKIRKDIDYLRGLLDFIQGKFLGLISITEKNVLAKLRLEFSSIFSEWFSFLVTDNLTVRLDEDFTPIITNQDYEIDYDFLSGGERTAVALAYRLSLNQVLNSMLSRIKTKDIVILDEPTDGFASGQIDKMRDIFDQLKVEQIIIVSHEHKIEGFVDHILHVKKSHSSRVESVQGV